MHSESEIYYHIILSKKSTIVFDLKKKKKKVGDRYVIQGQPEIIRNITDTGTSTPVHCMIAIMQLTFNNGLVWQYVIKC